MEQEVLNATRSSSFSSMWRYSRRGQLSSFSSLEVQSGHKFSLSEGLLYEEESSGTEEPDREGLIDQSRPVSEPSGVQRRTQL